MITESDDSEASKICKDCQELKPLSEFPRNSSRRDGRGTYCRSCYLRRHRAYRERQAQREGRTIRPRRVVPADMKYCAQCEQVLPIDAFGRNRSSRDGHTTYCRTCHNSVGKKNRERVHGSTRNYHLRRRYGLTSADVDAMIHAQGGVCAACGSEPPSHVDHDHSTGEVRGVLCFLCNQALGNVRDDAGRLLALVNYLDRHRHDALVIQTFLPPPGLDIEITYRGHAA